MVRQYLDTIRWDANNSETQYDSDGNPIPVTPVLSSTDQCRYENFQKGGRREYVNRNGEMVLATGTIYAKKGVSVPKRFTVITVECVNRPEPFQAEILNINYGQLNTTIQILEDANSH